MAFHHSNLGDITTSSTAAAQPWTRGGNRFQLTNNNLQLSNPSYSRNSPANPVGFSNVVTSPSGIGGSQGGLSSASSSRGSSLSPLISTNSNRIIVGGQMGAVLTGGKNPQYNPRNPLAGLYSPKSNHPNTRHQLQFQNIKRANTSIQAMQNTRENEIGNSMAGTYANLGENSQRHEYGSGAIDGTKGNLLPGNSNGWYLP